MVKGPTGKCALVPCPTTTWSLAELHSLCAKKGLSKRGNKNDLVVRLEKCFESAKRRAKKVVGQERAAKKEAIALEERLKREKSLGETERSGFLERLKREKSLGETERSGFLEKEIVDLLKRRAPGKTC